MERASRRQRFQRRIVRLEELLHLNRCHKAIALPMHRADEAWGPPPLLQRLPQRLNTGFQRLIANKRVRPQVLEEFLLEDDPLVMHQKVGEHL